MVLITKFNKETMEAFLNGVECTFHPGRKAVDFYSHFGYSDDIEPPDIIFICQQCVDEFVAASLKDGTMPQHWIKAEYETDLSEKLGYHLRNYEWVKKE